MLYTEITYLDGQVVLHREGLRLTGSVHETGVCAGDGEGGTGRVGGRIGSISDLGALSCGDPSLIIPVVDKPVHELIVVLVAGLAGLGRFVSKAKGVLDLSKTNDHGGAGGEAAHHRECHVVDKRTKIQQGQHSQDDADRQGCLGGYINCVL